MKKSELQYNKSLEFLMPVLAKEWDLRGNFPLTPTDVTCSSSKMYWWVCKNEHSWMGTIDSRINKEKLSMRQCPYCTRSRASKDYNLFTEQPDLAKEWHPLKNNGITPYDVFSSVKQKYWFTCGNGHDWEGMLSQLNDNSTCPICTGKRVITENSLNTLYPELMLEWHTVKNTGLDPTKLRPQSNVRPWWKCKNNKCNHEWDASLPSRVSGNGCPRCGLNKRITSRNENRIKNGNTLADIRPELITFWHPSMNGDLTPNKVTPQSNKYAWWRCERGHNIYRKINGAFKNGIICEVCNEEKNAISIHYPGLVEMWDFSKNNKRSPDNTSLGNHTKIWWKCSKAEDHNWQDYISNMIKFPTCPFCTKKRPSKDYCLASIHPLLAKQWHPNKNKLLTPWDVTPNPKKAYGGYALKIQLMNGNQV